MTANPYPLGTPERAEWDEINARVLAEYIEHRRMMDALAERGLLAEADEAEHAETAERLSASGVLFGPDVSQYQGKPDVAKAKAAGIALWIWKVSEGRTFLDSSAAHNAAASASAGLIRGCYHFLYYSDEYAANPALWAAQARWFVQNAPEDALHILDVEAAATSGHHLGVREWVAEYRRLLPGHRLGVYTNRSLWQNRSRMPYDPGPDLFDYAWHAGVGNGYYTTATGTIPQQWAAQGSLSNSLAGVGYPEVKLWQITDHASVPGVTASFCDGNGWQGTAAELRALITGEDPDMPLNADDISKIVEGVWSKQITGHFDKVPLRADTMLASTQRYSVEAGAPVLRPDGNSRPGTPTHALALAQAVGVVAADVDTLEESEAAQSKALKDAVAGISASVVAGLKDALPDTVQVDYVRVQGVVSLALDEHLGTLRIVSDAPQAAPGEE